MAGALHQQLEREACHQRDQTERKILPATEILRAATAAKAGGTDGQQGEADGRDHNRGYDRRHETTPIFGRQTEHDLQQASEHDRTGDGAIALILGDRHGGGDIGE